MSEEMAAYDAGANKKKTFSNTLYSTDSLTTAQGFINEIRAHVKSDNGEELYFASLGIFQGSEQGCDGKWQGKIVNCDVLVGSTLRKFAQSMISGEADTLKGVIFSFKIRNLTFTPDMYEDKQVLRSRGVLEMILIGHLDH